MRRAFFFLLLSALASAAEPDTAFFSEKVEPLLAERCYECHSHEKKIKGGLVLDSRAGWEKGGDSGPALVPGKPDDSLLIKAIRYSDPDLNMPPKRRLSEEEVATLTEWVRRGAPDPRSEPASGKPMTGMTLAAAKAWWAFQPLPPLNEAPGEVDRLIRAALAPAGLSPSPRADPRTLVRRLYFDLLGLPPPFAAVEKFAADPSPAAWAALIDELLARPEYGQRWGRHWLDVARYSDTYEQSTDSQRNIPFAWTYRDYVIDSFNADTPFPRFILEQVAADRLPAEEKPDLRALGFLTVGRRFSGNVEAPQLIIDDRIDVVSRALLGLTVACARCHDHKFDAIPTADYYSLYGILGSSAEPLDLPEVGITPDSEPVRKYRAARAALFAEYEQHIDACTDKARRLLRELAPEYLQYLVELSPQHRQTQGFIPLDTPRGLLVRGGPPRWEALIAASLARGEPFFRLWAQLLAEPPAQFAETLLAEDYDPRVQAAFLAHPPATMREAAVLYGRLVADSPALMDADASLVFTREEIAADLLRFITEHQLVSRPDGERAGGLREKLTALESSAPVPRAMAVQALAHPLEPHILPKGDRRQPGAAVPRRFLQALAVVDDRPYPDDGRLELAQAIASPANPLTARVLVNRVWQHHFGQGLVATPDNFGVMGERPSHPELLDHLAACFLAHGSSLKSLHRYLLTSETWQQSGALQPLAQEKDPANRLLWRMAPRRLEFEPMRDALLAIAGRLDVRPGGHSEPLTDGSARRAVYGFTDRFRIPALLRAFDVANPDTSISRRAETIQPLQALFFLNGPFVRAQSESALRQPELARAPERLQAIYRRLFARDPVPEELALAGGYLGENADEKRWVSLVQALLCSNEFTFCD